jgi:hypothetical protein
MIVPPRVNRQGRVVTAFQIDDEFSAAVLAYRWSDTHYRRGHRYMKTRMGGKHVLLHHYVWSLAGRAKPIHPDSLDHINRDQSDNRLANLRVASSRLQKLNRGALSSKKGDLPRGVQKVNHRRGSRVNGKYKASIRLTIGYFDTPGAASAAYEKFVSECIDRELNKESANV